METEKGRIAVGWLIVEDIAMVLTLVLIPAMAGLLKGDAADAAGLSRLAVPALVILAKVAAFAAVMLLVGRRVIPWILHYVAHTGSRELFRLSVLAIALGCAFGASKLFDVSFALGAFFAGMILSESELSQRAAQETLPLRDAFAVLFFVSVGMLFDPTILLREAGPVLATLFIIMFGKSIAAFLIMRLAGYATNTALTISASLAQIGEFSFILVSLGVALALLPERGRDLVLAGSIISIMLNPVVFQILDWAQARTEEERAEDGKPQDAEEGTRVEIPPTALTDHVVLIGHGRVGSRISEALRASGAALLVVEDNADKTAQLREQGVETITGNAADPELIQALNLPAARCLLVAIPDGFEGGQVVAQARGINADLPIIARSHSQDETAHLMKYGATRVVMGEEEIAKAMIADARAPDAVAGKGAYASETSLTPLPEQTTPSSAA